MTIGVLEAIQSLKPNASFGMRGVKPNATVSEQYNSVIWQDESQTKPTETEINNKIKELEKLEPERLVRIKRNRLLDESDWTQTRDNVRLNDNTWKHYRQELRDITKSSSFNPKLNADGTLDESSVTWPLKPST